MFFFFPRVAALHLCNYCPQGNEKKCKEKHFPSIVTKMSPAFTKLLQLLTLICQIFFAFITVFEPLLAPWGPGGRGSSKAAVVTSCDRAVLQPCRHVLIKISRSGMLPMTAASFARSPATRRPTAPAAQRCERVLPTSQPSKSAPVCLSLLNWSQ